MREGLGHADKGDQRPPWGTRVPQMLLFGFKPVGAPTFSPRAALGSASELPPTASNRCTRVPEVGLRQLRCMQSDNRAKVRCVPVGASGGAKCCEKSTNKWVEGGLVTGRPPPNCPIVLPQGPHDCTGPSRWLPSSYDPLVARGELKSKFCNIWQQFWDDFPFRRGSQY